MVQRRCTGDREAPLACEVSWLRRRRELEDMPTTHIGAREDCSPLPTCGRACGCACPCGCPCECDLDELTALLTQQNRLLCDILGAVNALTAAQLALGKS